VTVEVVVRCDDCGCSLELIHGVMRGALPDWYIGPARQLCPTCSAKPVHPTPDSGN